MPIFRSHHKNLEYIEYNFRQFIISIGSLIMVFREANLSFVHMLLAARLIRMDEPIDFVVAIK